MLMADCFAYSQERNNCSALKKLYCSKEQQRCKFYKTKEQFEKDEEAAKQRHAEKLAGTGG